MTSLLLPGLETTLRGVPALPVPTAQVTTTRSGSSSPCSVQSPLPPMLPRKAPQRGDALLVPAIQAIHALTFSVCGAGNASASAQ